MSLKPTEAGDHIAGQPRPQVTPRAPGGPLMQIRLTALSLAVQYVSKPGSPVWVKDDILKMSEAFYNYIVTDPE